MNQLHRFNDYKLCKELTDKALDILDELHDYAYESGNEIDYADKKAISAAVDTTRALWWTLSREKERTYVEMLQKDIKED